MNLYKFIFNKDYRLSLLTDLGCFNKLSDEKFLKMMFKVKINRRLNLDNPRSFNEKMQWLKLNNRNYEYTMMVDKYLVREYIKEKIGDKYLIPLLGVWEKAEDIDFESLPEKFVLKCNHNSGMGLCICRDKKTFDKDEAIRKLNYALKQDYYLNSREWPYKNVKRRIIAEELLENCKDESDDSKNEMDLPDYKFMCFNGKVKCSFVCSDRFSEDGLKVTFYDRDWEKMNFERHYPASKKKISKPVNYEKMIELAEILSKNIPFLRVDFYEVNNVIYFGELTFYPGGGFEEFTPYSADKMLGEWINLDKV